MDTCLHYGGWLPLNAVTESHMSFMQLNFSVIFSAILFVNFLSKIGQGFSFANSLSSGVWNRGDGGSHKHKLANSECLSDILCTLESNQAAPDSSILVALPLSVSSRYL